MVEVNIQPIILFGVLLDRQFPPHSPILQSLLIAIFHPLKPLCGFDLDVRVCLGILVNLDIDFEKVLDGVLLQLLPVSVFLEADGDQTELSKMST